jgi:hypothetical protein
MLVHCSLFKFKPETTADQAAQIVAQFEALGQKLPYIKKMTVGLNVSDIKIIREIAASSGVHHVQDPYHLAAVIHFETLEDYYRYGADETHSDFVRRYLIPNQESRASVQFIATQSVE